MVVEMFNFWYFFWLILAAGVTAGLYFLLRKASPTVQKIVLFSILVVGLVVHFLKAYIPPYSVDEARMLRDSWFVNICGANIALFPFMFWTKNEKVKDYMFYIGVISGLIALFYPQEPLAKGMEGQLAEQLDVIRFYFHHWMLMAVPLLMVLLGHHKISYKRVHWAPTCLLIVMLFIILNQVFQWELGFFTLWDAEDFCAIHFKNTSYIWGPGENDAIGEFFALFTPKLFTTVPVGEFAGQAKYWPWFWMIVPCYVLVTPLSFLVSMIFDRKSLRDDALRLNERLCNLVKV